MKALTALLSLLLVTLSLRADAVTNGTDSPRITPLSAGQILAIGFLAHTDGSAFCSGTVIRGNVVLTAQHCLKDTKPGDVLFGIGAPASPLALLRVKRISLADWETDLALLDLDGDATSVGGLQIIPINRTALDATLEGTDVEIAGYAPIDGVSRRRFGIVEVKTVYDAVTLDGLGAGGACQGDSGGPFLLVDDANHVSVGGTAIGGDLSCRDNDYYSRVDRQAAWVDQEIAWFDQDTDSGTPSQGTRVSPEPWTCAGGGASTAMPLGLAIGALLVGAASRRRA